MDDEASNRAEQRILVRLHLFVVKRELFDGVGCDESVQVVVRRPNDLELNEEDPMSNGPCPENNVG